MQQILMIIRDCFNSIPDNDRRSKIPPLTFVSALVFALNQDSGSRSLAGLRRGIGMLTGKLLCRSTFWERMSTGRLEEALIFLVCTLMARAGARLIVGRDILKKLGVGGLFILDSSSITLPGDAAKQLPGPRRNVAPAVMKWHALFDFFNGQLVWFDLTAGKVHDRKAFPILDVIPRGSLLIMDLGYYDYLLFQDLLQQGIHFLSRVKSNAVIRVEQVVSGIPKKYTGKSLMTCRFPTNAGNIVELIGSFQKAGKEVLSCRVIGFWNPVEKVYHWYATNLSVPAKLVYPLYRLRWQCELAFKACKSSMRLAQISTSNVRIIRNLVLTGIVHCLISLTLGNAATQKLNLEKQLTRSLQRSAMIFAQLKSDLHDFITKNTDGRRLKTKIKLLREELMDPNYRKRKSSLAEIHALI